MARLRRKNLDYDVAALIAQKAGCRSRKEFWEWHDRARPNNIPKHPNAYYHEWVTWGEFLDTDNSFEPREKMNARPYWEAVRWAQKHAKADKVTTSIKWLHYYEQGHVPADIPKRPNQYYKEWQGWRVWLGTTIEARIVSEKEQVGVFALANDRHSAKNVIYVVFEKDGLHALKEKLIERELKAIVVYDIAPDEYQMAQDLLMRITRPQRDGTFIAENLNNVLFEFDNALNRTDLKSV